jgi:hypothetical protein
MLSTTVRASPTTRALYEYLAHPMSNCLVYFSPFPPMMNLKRWIVQSERDYLNSHHLGPIIVVDK